MEEILEIKERGNALFRNEQYEEAIEVYTEAIFTAETTHIEPPPDKIEVIDETGDSLNSEDQSNSSKQQLIDSQLNDLKGILYGNRATCYKMLDDPEKCLQDCDHSLSLKTPNPKVRARRSWALRKQGKANEALEELKRAYEEDPSLRASYSTEYAELEKEAREETERLKTEALGQLKDLGNKFLGLFGMSLDNFQMQQNPDGGYNVQFKK